MTPLRLNTVINSLVGTTKTIEPATEDGRIALAQMLPENISNQKK